MKQYRLATPKTLVEKMLQQVEPYEVQEQPFMSNAEKAVLKNMYSSINTINQTVALTSRTPVGSKVQMEKGVYGGHTTERILFQDPSGRTFQWVKKNNPRGIVAVPFHRVLSKDITPLWML